MSRARPQANDNAAKLIEWLEARFREAPTYGWYLDYIAQELRWSYEKTRQTIYWCRNGMSDSRYMIHAFKKGRRWCYKIPDLDEARRYEDARGKDVAVRSGHVLLGIRKRAIRFGVTRETSKRASGYTEILRWLREVGVVDAEAILEEALREVPSPVAVSGT